MTARDASATRGARVDCVTLGVRLALERLGRRFVVVTTVLATTGVALAATLERRGAPVRAPDHTLIGAVFGIALPLVAYATVARVTERTRIEDAVEGIARHGADRRLVLLGLLVGLAASVAVMGAWLALVGVIIARGTGDPMLVADAAVSARIGLVGGVAYAALFALGASVRWTRVGTFSLLAADWVLGSTTSALSVVFPRSHLRNLLGAEPVLSMAQWQGFAALYALSLVCALVVLGKARR